MPLPQFMKQISAERNFTTPGTLLRLDPNATAAGATHLLVLGKDEQENIILLPGESRSDLLSADGDVHCWVLSQEELEGLEPEYDGKIPDKLRLVSVEEPEVDNKDTAVAARKLNAISAPKYAIGDGFKIPGSDQTTYINSIMLSAGRGAWIYGVKHHHNMLTEQELNTWSGTRLVRPRMPQPKFNLLDRVEVDFHGDGEWIEGATEHAIRWSQSGSPTTDDLTTRMGEEDFVDQWIYYVKLPGEALLHQIPESNLRPVEQQAPEIEGEDDLVIAQSEPKKLTYDPENPGQYFYLERPSEQAPPATPVDESKIPEYLHERQQPVMKNVKPSTPVMQDLRQELDDPDRMLKALAIHIHELEVLRTTVSNFSESINAAMDYARRGLEKVQVSVEDEQLLLREVAPFKHRDQSGNLMHTPKIRKEWAKARQALTILDKIRSGLETTGLMAVNFRGIVYQLREETELIIRASQHATDPKVAGFRDWAMTFNEFAVWWDAKRIEQNRQIKNVQGALKSAWKRYRTKHAFFYKRILTRFGKLKKALRSLAQSYGTWPSQPPFAPGVKVRRDPNLAPDSNDVVKVIHLNALGSTRQWLFSGHHQNGKIETLKAAHFVPAEGYENVPPPPPAKFNYDDHVTVSHEKGRWEGRIREVYLQSNLSTYQPIYHYIIRIDGGGVTTGLEHQIRYFAPQEAPEIEGEDDIIIAKRTAQNDSPEFQIGDEVKAVIPPRNSRSPMPRTTIYESAFVKKIDAYEDGSYIYWLQDNRPDATNGLTSAHASDLTLINASNSGNPQNPPRYRHGLQFTLELGSSIYPDQTSEKVPTLMQINYIYNSGDGWIYTLTEASKMETPDDTGWQVKAREEDIGDWITEEQSEAGTEIAGEDDIIIAQKDEFDEIEWLTEVETDIEDLSTEIEMMNEFYSQAAEQGQQLATTREVYETNHGKVPGDPAVVDMPMAAAARVGEMVDYAVDFEDAVPLKIKTARIIGTDDHNITVVDNEGKTQLVARGMVVTSQGDKIRRKRKRRRKVKPIEQVEETDTLDFLGKPTKVPKQKKQPEPKEEKVQLTPMKQQPNQPAAPEGTIPVATPPEQVGAEPITPVPQEVQQPVAPVMQPVQLIQQTPPPPPSPAPPPVPAPEEMDAVDFTDIPDAEWRTLSNAEKIRMAAVFNRIMIIEYQKVSAPEEGVIKSYQVEPYSYRVKRPQRTGGTPVWYLFAHDVIDNHIKAFIVRNIRDVEIIDQSFSPRWDVEFTYNERWERFRKKTTKPGAPPSEVEFTDEGFDL